nr:integrase, catalytic region, zinc finger, CCHC-type, peptidase aspartic, catalytic [Tanacetum cinerariifolium]
MSVQMVELDKHVRDLKNTVLEKDFKFSELEECMRNKDLEIEKGLERLNVCENKLHKIGQTNQTVHMIMPSKDNLYNGRKGIGFENLSYFEKAKDLRPTLYDEKVIGLGYTPMFLTHSEEALKIEKFKRYRENKIEFAYDYRNLNASYVNEKINFEDDYFQKIINPDFEKIDSPKKPCDSMHVRSKSNSNKSLSRTVHKWLPKLQLFAEPVAKWFPRVMRQIDKISKTPNSPGPIYKWHMTGNRALMMNFVEKFLETVRFGNNDFVVIAGYGDVVIVSMTIKKVYYVEGLGHNLFSVGQFCDKGLEVAFRNAFDCNNARIALRNARMNASVDVNDLFLFDDVSIRKSHVSKISFRKKPHDSMNIIQICLWIIDSGCSKHMTGNRALLKNFVEKFIGTVRFGNNDFAVIAG